MKTIAYIRVSTEKQAEEGVSLEYQRAQIEAYAKYRNLILMDIVEDAGMSGGNNQRRGFSTILSAIEAGVCEAVIVYDLSRLSRDMLTLLALERVITEAGVQLHTVEGQIDTTTPDGFMSYAMRAFLGEMERRQVKYRTKAAMQHKKSEGLRVGTVPYGSKLVGDHLEANDEEATVILEAAEEYHRSFSLTLAANHLNDMGFRTRSEKKWTAKEVSRIIPGYKAKKQKSGISESALQLVREL